MPVIAPPTRIQMAIGPMLATFISDLVQAWKLTGAPPVRVTSWYRDPVRNRQVGGHPRSLHMLGLALDLQLPLSGTEVEASFLSNARRVGMIGVDERSHLHFQAFPASTLFNV